MTESPSPPRDDSTPPLYALFTDHRLKNPPPPRKDNTSALLRRMLDGLPPGNVAISHIVFEMRRRSFGGVIILLTMLGLLPIVSFFAGLVLIIPGLQLTLGLLAPALPGFIGDYQVPSARVRTAGDRILPFIVATERYIRPRWLVLTQPVLLRATGVLIILLAFALLIPLPLMNLPPALALLCLALGILERDGILMAAGYCLSALALFLGGVSITIILDGLAYLFR